MMRLTTAAVTDRGYKMWRLWPRSAHTLPSAGTEGFGTRFDPRH